MRPQFAFINYPEEDFPFLREGVLTAARPGLSLETDTQMTSRFPRFTVCFLAGTAFFCPCAVILAQSAGQTAVLESQEERVVAAVELPDAPLPQQPATPAAPQNPPQKPDSPAATTPGATPSGAAGTDSSSSSSTSGSQSGTGSQTTPQKTQREIAEEQLKQEKTQRIGILPNFNASYINGAVPLTAGQKFRLMFSTEKDPATFGFSMFVALIGQAEGSHPAYGGGIGGYGKRFGQNYADTFDGAFWGNAVLPALWHQDPRYFRLGQGPPMHRIFYALSTNVRAKHDGTGKWEPNYSNLVGNLISGGISNIYLPANERGVGSTFEGAFLVTAEGGVGSMLEEFWPDFIHYLQRKKRQKQAPDVTPAP